MENRRKKQMKKLSFEEQNERLTNAVKMFLQIFGFLGVIGSIVYAGMEFYIETINNDETLKKEIVVKGEEIKDISNSLKENFREHREIKEKITEIHSDVKLIRSLLEYKKTSEGKGLASFDK